MAQAAEEQVRWTSRLYYLTAWEIGALVLTLLATAAAAIAAVVAAKAARAAVQVASNTAERQLRAYVVAGTDAEWQQAYVGSPDNIVGYNFAMNWKNCGPTPARRCQTRTSLAVLDGVIPSDFDYPDKAVLEITKTNHIGPSQDFRSKVGGLSIPDAEAAERGEKHAYVWSWIEYDDIFGRVRHRTEVCYELRISNGRQTCTPTIVGPFNGADEDCYHQPKT